jgi:hypothetical protein
VFLKIGTGIGRVSPVHPARSRSKYLCCERYSRGTLLGMFQRTEHLYITVLADIIVITCTEEALAQVVCYQIMFGIATVTAGSGTVDNDEVGKSHVT